MYPALLLTPWILMYALSTVAMNHRLSFQQHFGGDVPWEKQSEQTLSVPFSGDATAHFMAAQILQGLYMWWHLKRFRKWGLLALRAGGAVLTAFLIGL